MREEDEVKEEERKMKKKSRSLERVVSLTSARLIIIINSNLGISPPEGTSRLYWEGRAHGGEANVVKAGCSSSRMELKAGCGGTPQRRLLAASLLLLEYRFTDFLAPPLPLYSRVNRAFYLSDAN